ncbi:PQQ-binding-like beta-propeller repeat protein, partial [Sinomonas atrocyanea]|uniref:outer membrane protein assembly factor BamB family protein n=1 Tax=Sinomonas atrocyanea TaxID=37927 RepID=UPI002789160E
MDPALSVSKASTLKAKWKFKTGGPIATSTSVVGTTAYVGSWDGYEYAVSTGTGALIWKQFLGLTQDPACQPPTIGVTSAAAVVNGVVYVGGGDSYWYALDATTGAILWKVFTGDNSQTGAHYNWASPLIANGAAYVGVASNCDNPLVQGHLMKVDLASHAVVADYNFVPTGQVGGGVWTSPALDAATNTVFVSTGTINDYTQKQSQAIVALDAATLAYKSSWQLPFEAAVQDSDWGTTPTLTTDSKGDRLLSVANKNGVVYTFNRDNLAAGPVWQRRIALGGDCPTCGDGTIASGVFANNVLYFAGGNNTGNGHGSGGSISALDPATGTVIWTRQTEQAVMAAPALVNGMLGLVEGSTFEAVNAADGTLLYSYQMGGPGYAAVSVARSQFYVGDYDTNLYAFGLGATTAVPADTNCPTGFTCQDIRNPAIAGSESTAGGTLTVTASGASIHGTADQFRFISKPVTGDTQLSATITAQSTQNTQPQAGVMVRQNADPGSPFFAALAYPNDLTEGFPSPDVVFWYRACFGCNSIELTKWYPANKPVSLMLQRKGNLFSAGISFDGTNYQLVPGASANLDLPAAAMGGLAVDSGSSTNTGTASFTNLSVGVPITTTMTPQPPADPCPAPWTCADIGNPNPPGDTTAAGSSITLDGTGTGIGGARDSFHYAFTPVSGNQSLSAQVVTQTGSPNTAQEGLMMRASTSASSPFYGIFLNPGGSATISWRTYDGVAQRSKIPLTSVTSPAYLQIVRYQDTTLNPPVTFFSTLTSSDGSTWTPALGSTVAIDMGDQYLAGMAATSGTPRVAPPVVYNNVAITVPSSPPPGICATGFSCADIGVDGLLGNQIYLNGTWTMQARGSDIWSTYDSFRFVSQAFPRDSANSTNGDGTVSARVVSQTKVGGAWMKSGVMIRAGSDPQAAYYGVFVTPGNGIAVQWRGSNAAQTNSIVTPGAAPQWVLASRYTDTAHGLVYYSAYTSIDGVTFTYVPGSAVALNLPGPLVAGIASDSYNSTQVSVATFDNVAQLSGSQPPPGLCPAAWTCSDIGGALPAGTDNLSSSGTWTETGGGGDIWGTADSFHLVQQTLTGDGTVSAHVTAQQVTDPWAKAGPMLRATTDPGSPYYGVFVTPGNGIDVQWRASQGGASSQVLTAGSVPTYLRVGRYTDTAHNLVYYSAYSSPDGATWTLVPGSTVALDLPQPLLAGFAITSHLQGTSSAVTLDTVAVSTTAVAPPGLCPAAWTCSDIGGALPAGTDNLSSSGTWTETGGGGDIWGTADSFHLVQQTLTGDGT